MSLSTLARQASRFTPRARATTQGRLASSFSSSQAFSSTPHSFAPGLLVKDATSSLLFVSALDVSSPLSSSLTKDCFVPFKKEPKVPERKKDNQLARSFLAFRKLLFFPYLAFQLMDLIAFSPPLKSPLHLKPVSR